MSCKECERIITDIYKTHSDDKGHWIKDPRLTSKENERVIVKKVVEEAQKKTINEVIEILHKQEFPRSKASGKLDFKSAKVYSRYLLGYNKRHQHLEFINDNKGNGKINLKANYHFRTAKPDSFDSLFKRYPAGTGKLKDTKEILDRNYFIWTHVNNDQIENAIKLIEKAGAFSIVLECLSMNSRSESDT